MPAEALAPPTAPPLENPVIPASTEADLTRMFHESAPAADDGGDGAAELDALAKAVSGEESEPPAPPATPEKKEPAKVEAKTPAAEESPKPTDQPVKPEASVDPKAADTKNGSRKDVLKGIPVDYPAKHKEAASGWGKMRRALEAALTDLDGKEKELGEVRSKAASTPPPDYEETKNRYAATQAQLAEIAAQKAELEDRYYAEQVRARPEYKQHVTDRWASVRATIDGTLKRSGQNYQDLDAALRNPDEDAREAIINEMSANMQPRDQFTFNQSIQAIAEINRDKTLLETDSKARLDAQRARDKQLADGKRAAEIGALKTSQMAHREAREKAFPFLKKLEGDTPEAKQFNEGLSAARAWSEKVIADGGVDALPPHIKAAVVEDAAKSDLLFRAMSSVLDTHAKEVGALKEKLSTAEAALKTAQSELDEIKGVSPEGGSVTAPDRSGDENDISGVLGNLARVMGVS